MSLDIPKIKADFGLEANGRVQKFFTNTCYRHMDKYVPKQSQSGNLASIVQVKSDEIVYKMPYAHYQYIGELYVDPETGSPFARKGVTKIPTGKPLKYHTPGTGPYWDKRMVSAEMDQVVEEVQNYLIKKG